MQISVLNVNDIEAVHFGTFVNANNEERLWEWREVRTVMLRLLSDLVLVRPNTNKAGKHSRQILNSKSRFTCKCIYRH